MFHRCYEFYKLLHEYIKLFPKQEKYGLGQRLENITLDILSGVIKAGTTGRIQKEVILLETSNNLDLLKVLVRLAKDVKAIDNKKYIKLESELQEIGKMLGGWIRSI